LHRERSWQSNPLGFASTRYIGAEMEQAISPLAARRLAFAQNEPGTGELQQDRLPPREIKEVDAGGRLIGLNLVARLDEWFVDTGIGRIHVIVIATEFGQPRLARWWYGNVLL
jgi:hypothetical protein